MNEKEDILHNGGLEGLRSFDLFKRRTPGFRRYQSDNIKVIDRWHLKICKNNNPRLPYRYWLSVVGLLRDGTMVQSSPILDIESPRVLVTENSRYRLQNSELRKTLPHLDFDRQELNKFLNGFPRDWMNIFRKELEKVYGKNLYNTEDLNKEHREINREIDKVFESLQEEEKSVRDVPIVREQHLRDVPPRVIPKPNIRPVFIPDAQRLPVRPRFSHTYTVKQKRGGVMSNQNILALQEGGLEIPSTVREVGKQEDIFRNVPQEILIDQTDIENLLKPQEKKVSEGVDWLPNKKVVNDETVNSQGVPDQSTFSQGEAVDRMNMSQGAPDHSTMSQGIANQTITSQGIANQTITSQGIANQTTISQGVVSTLGDLKVDATLDSSTKLENTFLEADDLFENILKDTGIGLEEESEKEESEKDEKEKDISLINIKKGETVVEEKDKSLVEDVKPVDVQNIDSSMVNDTSLVDLSILKTPKKDSSLVDSSLVNSSMVESSNVNSSLVDSSTADQNQSAVSFDTMIKKKEKRKKKALERKSLNEESVKNYIKEINEDADYAFEKNKKRRKSLENNLKKIEISVTPKKEEKKKKDVEKKEEKKDVEKKEEKKKVEVMDVEIKGKKATPTKAKASTKDDKSKDNAIPKGSFSAIVEDFIPSSQVSVSSTRTGKKTKRKKITMPRDFRSLSRKFK